MQYMKDNISVLDVSKSFKTLPYANIFVSLWDVLNCKIEKKCLELFGSNGFLAGIIIYMYSRKYDVIVTYGHRSMFSVSFCRFVFGTGNVKHIAKELMFETSGPQNLLSCIHWFFIRLFISRVTLFVVNSSAEINEYAKLFCQPINKFEFVYWPSNIDASSEVFESDGTILAVGKSLRDWKTFFAAVHDVSNVVVVASKKDIQNLLIPPNITLHCDISRELYLKLLKKCSFVVVPLYETIRSTGQVAFLEAMAVGKPVIVAKVNGTVDYIDDNENGIFYRAHDSLDLNSKIKLLLSDARLFNRISKNSIKSVSEKYNRFQYSQAMYDLVLKLCR